MSTRRSRRCRVSERGSQPLPVARLLIRPQSRNAASARVGRSSSSGRTTASAAFRQPSCSQRRNTPTSFRTITSCPSCPGRSETSPPSCATSKRRALKKRFGAGSSRTMVGSTSGRQNTAAWSADSLGSTGKREPPTPGEGFARHAPGTGVGGGSSNNRFVVLLIARIASQEFPRETGTIKLLEVVTFNRRTPVEDNRHRLAPKIHCMQRMPVQPTTGIS
jgi:hypothetical protein